jgi:perosamine synthetase
VIAHNKPTLGRAECKAAVRALDSGWIAQGKEVEGLEEDVCQLLGLAAGHAVALSSGTAALFLALWILQAKRKRIGIPVYSCAALRNAVLMAGAEPVSIDVAEDSPNMDLDAALAHRVDIAVAAHMFGFPSRYQAADTAVPIIEDCAQAFGARIDGQVAGLNGSIGVFSFYATKMLTTGGQGGMLVSSNRTFADAARDFREFDCRRDRAPRFNLQMTDLQAAIGRAQLSQLPNFIARRKEICATYAEAGLPLWPRAAVAGCEPCHYRAVLRVSDPVAVIAGFARGGVRAIVPVEEWELLEDAAAFPRAAALARSTVSIPIYPALTASEVANIVAVASRLNYDGESKPI